MEISEIKQISEQLVRIQNYDSKSIAREAELGSQMGFSESSSDVEQVINIFKKLDADTLVELPPAYLRHLRDQMTNFQQMFNGFLNFNPQQNPHSRQQIINQFKQYAQNVFDNLALIIGYQKAILYSPDEKLNTEKIYLEEKLKADRIQIDERARLFEEQFNIERGRLAEKEEQLNEALSRLNSVEAEFRNITANMQEQAAESGITQEALHFDAAAAEFGRSADNWKMVVFFLSLVTIAIVIIGFFFMKPPERLEEVIHFIASKVMIFGVLFFMLGVSAKSYMYSMHNKVVNLHRKNALLSYRALIGGATQSVIKDRVLEHASICIYTHQDTGYLKNSSGPNSIVEIMPKAAFEGKIADST